MPVSTAFQARSLVHNSSIRTGDGDSRIVADCRLGDEGVRAGFCTGCWATAINCLTEGSSASSTAIPLSVYARASETATSSTSGCFTKGFPQVLLRLLCSGDSRLLSQIFLSPLLRVT